MWSDDKNIHNTIITQFKDDYLTYKDECWIRTRKSYGANRALISSCIKLLKTQCIDNEWLKQNQNSSLGKLLFKNGYLNLRTNEFIEGFNPEIVFFCAY